MALAAYAAIRATFSFSPGRTLRALSRKRSTREGMSPASVAASGAATYPRASAQRTAMTKFTSVFEPAEHAPWFTHDVDCSAYT